MPQSPDPCICVRDVDVCPAGGVTHGHHSHITASYKTYFLHKKNRYNHSLGVSMHATLSSGACAGNMGLNVVCNLLPPQVIHPPPKKQEQQTFQNIK